MSNVFTLPFNFKPASTTEGNAASSYTPTSGKYAIVTVTMFAYTTSSDVTATGAQMIFTPDSQSTSFQVYLDSTDTLAFTTTPANEAVATAGSVAAEGAVGSDTSQVTCTVNGNTVATLEASGSVSIKVDAGVTTAASVTISGSAGANFIAHEYNEIS